MPEPTLIRAGERLCPDCKGRGRVWCKVCGGRNVELSCGTCYGSGKISPQRTQSTQRNAGLGEKRQGTDSSTGTKG